MEEILQLYALPYNPLHPIVCFDERPCFLIGDVIQPLPTRPGSIKKEHYAYEKNGSCCLLAAVEPLTGKRLVHVYDRRRKIEYAQFMQNLANLYPDAHKIHVVQDNLNTHNYSSFYENYAAQEAQDLKDRFVFHYTPKSASWLNMIEIEFAALTKQCLQQRIATKQELEKQILAIVKERNEKAIKIQWQFSIESARSKLNRHYTRVNEQNLKYSIT